jgi:polyisoprenoid-binding protein YceI
MRRANFFRSGVPRRSFGALFPALTLLAALDIPVAVGAQASAHAIRFVLAPDGNEARYRVREQLATLSFPSDAVGKTTSVHGAIVIEPDGRIDDGSRILVDLTSIASDSKTRDTYVRRHIFVTDSFPTIQFVPTAATGLPARIPAATDLTFALIGTQTVHGVTKPCTWQVKGKMLDSGEFSGTATTTFRFAEYDLAQPSVAHVLSVVDSITLEFDFHLVPQAALTR